MKYVPLFLREIVDEAPCTCKNPEPYDWPCDPNNADCYRNRMKVILSDKKEEELTAGQKQSIKYNPVVDEIDAEMRVRSAHSKHVICFYGPKGNSLHEAFCSNVSVEEAIKTIIEPFKDGQTVFNAYSPTQSKAKRPDGT